MKSLTKGELAIYKEINSKLENRIEEIVEASIALEDNISLEELSKRKYRTNWTVSDVELYCGKIFIDLEDIYNGGIDTKTISIPEDLVCNDNWLEELYQLHLDNAKVEKEYQEFQRLLKKFNK